MRITAVSISSKKGEKKENQPEIELITNFGVKGDAHADGTHRQLSLLDAGSIAWMREKGADVHAGDFAENITVDCELEPALCEYPVGTRFSIGEVLLELTQIGKECHQGCAIMKQVGTCIMPRRGIFCRILHGGIVRPGDPMHKADEALSSRRVN